MQPKHPFKLMLPQNSHQRRQEPVPHLNNYFSRDKEAEKGRSKSEKDLSAKSPPTPNLEFLKMNRMKKQQETCQRNPNARHRSPIAILQKSTEDLDEPCQGSHPFKQPCTSHPSKKAKYVLASDSTVGLCSKCAVNYAQVQPILDQEKYEKLKGIDDFRSMIKMVKGLLSEREEEVDKQFKEEDFHYDNAIRTIDHEFESIILLVQQKHDQLIDVLIRRYHQSAEKLVGERSTIVAVSTAMEKYLVDVDRNYQEIVSDLSMGQFNDIMNQYKAKISDFVSKVDKAFDPLLDIESLRQEAVGVSVKIKRMSLERVSHRTLVPERGENCNLLNRIKARTPDRAVK